MRDRRPEQVKLPFFLWTRGAVPRLIEEQFGVVLAVRTVGDYLAPRRLTAQKPVVRVCERIEPAVQRWLTEDYPAIAARANREGAAIWLGAETGLRSRSYPGTSFSPGGRPPVTKGSGAYFGCSLISSITNRGELAFMVYDGKFNAAVFRDFMERLIEQAEGRELFLILDNLKVHKARVLRPWHEEQAHEIELFFIPSYSPDLNPDEILNHDLKANAVGR
jgi:transposase